jgi:non-canonical poly(A) RNA polymerase PAPD5/7
MEKPAGMGESRDTSSQFRRRGGGRGGPGFAPRKRLAADRPMLSLAQTSNSDEITLGVDDTRSKYRAVVDLTDEPESDGSGGGEDGHANKRIRTEAAAPPVDNTPKWSNPDPYSVLPPMETGSRKTTTIIDLIQKARIENDEKKAVTTVVEDFISFDDEDDGKRSARNRRGRSPSSSPEPSQHRNRSRSRDRRDAAMAERETDPLGSRKRTFDDNLKPPSYIKAKGKALREAALGEVISEWAAVPEEDDCPWNQRDCTGNPQLNHW